MKVSPLTTLEEKSLSFHLVIKSIKTLPVNTKVFLLQFLKREKTNTRTTRSYASLHWLVCGNTSRVKITATDNSSSNTRSWWWSATVTNILGKDSKINFCTFKNFYSNLKMVKIFTSFTTKTMMPKIPKMRFSLLLSTLTPPATLHQSSCKRTRMVSLKYRASLVARSWLALQKT